MKKAEAFRQLSKSEISKLDAGSKVFLKGGREAIFVQYDKNTYSYLVRIKDEDKTQHALRLYTDKK